MYSGPSHCIVCSGTFQTWLQRYSRRSSVRPFIPIITSDTTCFSSPQSTHKCSVCEGCQGCSGRLELQMYFLVVTASSQIMTPPQLPLLCTACLNCFPSCWCQPASLLPRVLSLPQMSPVLSCLPIGCCMMFHSFGF